MTIQGKTAYPYITEFKKELFVSFAFVKDIGAFYISKNDEILKIYHYFNEDLFTSKLINLENVYWFLLLRKYLGEDEKENIDEIYEFIKKCEIFQEGKLGFKQAPNSPKKPDIWSTYYALASLKLIGLIKEYLASKGMDLINREIKDFILAHKKGNKFLHCLEIDCEICKKTSSQQNLYFAIESFILLGVDVRVNKSIFLSFLGDKKREPSIIFKLLCFKHLDLEYNVKDREIQYLLQFQKENGGFSFKKLTGRINTTFWITFALDNYSWLLDYNPVGIYSFINSTLNEILSENTSPNLIKLMDISKLIILLSIIWNKFINEIERFIFKQLDLLKYVDLNQVKTAYGLTHGIEEVISYINSYYTINLKILDNKVEFRNYLVNLNERNSLIASTISDQLLNNSIISLSDIIKKYNIKQRNNPIKIRDVRSLVLDMVNRNYFKGQIKTKKKFLVQTKYYFYLDFFLEKIIVSDTEVNIDRLYYEKSKLKDIKNDIFNMTLKLKTTSVQIKEEIESYLLLEELSLAKERLKYVIRDALMEADFLNENIENSFNEDLYYIDIHNIFKSEIAQWSELYEILSKKLKEVNAYLMDKISEKEEIRDLNKSLDELEEKIFVFSEAINRKIDDFKQLFRETFEKGYSDKGFSLIIKEFEKLRQNIDEFGAKIHEISQKITLKEELIVQKRTKIINKWISINELLTEIFKDYLEGFNFFKENLDKIGSLKNNFIQKSNAIGDKAQNKVDDHKFVEAFNIIKDESERLLNDKIYKIKELQKNVKTEIKSKQKLYLLYRHLLGKLDLLEGDLVSIIQEQEQTLKNIVIESRNRAILKDFDNFVSKMISKFKTELKNYKNSLDQSADKKIKEIINGFGNIQNKFDETDRLYLKKLNNCRETIVNFDDKYKVTTIQWENFKEYINHEISVLKDDYINNIITEKINSIVSEKKTNTIKVSELKKELGLKCKVLMERIRDMIEISKLNAELYEAEKCVLIYTNHYYKNKDLRNFIESKLLKLTRETVGKILALYDSSIRNRTLNVNMLELKNRINDLNFDEIIRIQFNNKIEELQIDKTRKEFLDTKNYLDLVIKNNELAIDSIKSNLELFTNKQNFIAQEFNVLKLELNKKYAKIFEEIEKSRGKAYLKVKESFERKWTKLASQFEQTQETIENDLKLTLNKSNESFQLASEIGEFIVKKKKEFAKEYEDKKEKIIDELRILKNEAFRGKLITYINNKKILMSQLLGTLQARVEDDIETKEFRRAHYKVQKRVKHIELEVKEISKDIKSLVKDFNKQTINFELKNKHILDDFNKFVKGYFIVLMEKVKSLERIIVKTYIEMAIKAVANEYLTIGFLNNELRIKKKKIQDHLIFLISVGMLKGKYDPRFGIYYENPEILDDLDVEELETIKKMNFRVYMFLRRIKTFLSHYGSIFGFFASLLAITYYIYIFSGSNPAVLAFPILIVLILVFYFIFKRGKEEKVKV